jgi:hypothetical protein
MLIILFLSQFLKAQEPLLEGVWSQPCQNQLIRTEDFQGTQVSLAERYYRDKFCTEKLMDFESHGNFRADNGEIDFMFQQIDITVHDIRYIEDFNDRKVCGIDVWTLSKPQNVTGRFCEIFGPGLGIQTPPAGQQRFGIYKIDGERLFFGKMTQDQDASTPDKRPIDFDPRFYQRQK